MNSSFKKHSFFYTSLFIICITAFLSKFCIQLTLIQGDSMLPAYHNGQFVLISKLADDYTYGDIVTFKTEHIDGILVKRIIAMPKDTIQIVDGVVYVNNQPSPLVSSDIRLSYSGIAAQAITLAEDEYFVLGDNYEESKDSRYTAIGCLKKTDIIGKILF